MANWKKVIFWILTIWLSLGGLLQILTHLDRPFLALGSLIGVLLLIALFHYVLMRNQKKKRPAETGL